MSNRVTPLSSNAGYEIPNPLVFLDKTDYDRLDINTKSFFFQMDKSDRRNPFERDRSRILNSPFFRILGDKSQIFEPRQSDFFRTRLTHSLEVAQTGKIMTIEFCEKYRALGVDPPLSPWEQVHLCDLAEAVCLAHDLGMPPFGHIGEKTLNEISRKYGGEGFEANAQTLRILTRLDKAYAGRSGYTKGVIAGIMKYKIKRSVGLPKFIYDDDWFLVEKVRPGRLRDKSLSDAKKSRTLICQVMDLSDEISYAGHDIEDILHSQLLRPATIKNIETLSTFLPPETVNEIQTEVELESGVRPDLYTIDKGWKKLQHHLLQILVYSKAQEFDADCHMLKREHINSACISCWSEKNTEDDWFIRISLASGLRSALLRHIVDPLVYKDSKLVTLQRKGTKVIRDVFEELMDNGEGLFPLEYQDRAFSTLKTCEKARVCCDFIAGMTEEHILRFYERLFGSSRGLLTDFF